MRSQHSIRNYLSEVLLASYSEMCDCLEDGVIGRRRDIIALGRAAGACLDLIDHLFHDESFSEHRKQFGTIKSLKEDLTERSKYFAISRDIANAVKHRTITRKGATISGVDALVEHFAIVRIEDFEGLYFYGRKVVVVTLSDGGQLLGEDVIRGCINFIEYFLASIGLVVRFKSLRNPKKCPPRLDVTYPLSVKFIGEVGEYVHHGHLVLEYDEKTGVLVPTSK